MKECSICLDDICHISNTTTTECGHHFHTSCLMKNVSHNGFGCPNCRSAMAEEINDDDSDESSLISDDEEEIFSDDALTSFRMFHQQLNHEEVEEEPEEWEDEDDEEGEDTQSTTQPNALPTPTYVARMLVQKGITMEDLVKVMLLNHAEYDEPAYDEELNRADGVIFGKIRQIIINYKPEHDIDLTSVTEHNTTIAAVPPLDNAADTKVTLRSHQRTREFLST